MFNNYKKLELDERKTYNLKLFKNLKILKSYEKETCQNGQR